MNLLLSTAYVPLHGCPVCTPTWTANMVVVRAHTFCCSPWHYTYYTLPSPLILDKHSGLYHAAVTRSTAHDTPRTPLPRLFAA